MLLRSHSMVFAESALDAIPTNSKLDDLPLEVWQRIVSYSPFKSLIQLRLTCKETKAIAEDEQMWRGKIEVAFGSYYNDLFSQYRAYEVFVGLCLVKAMVFWADRGNDNDPVLDEVEEDTVSNCVVGTDIWARKIKHEMNKQPEDIDTALKIYTSPNTIYGMTSQGDFCYDMLKDFEERPFEQPSLDATPLQVISTGSLFSAALTNDNGLMDWSSNPNGNEYIPEPYDPPALGAYDLKQVEVGKYFCYCLTTCGQVFFWDHRWMDTNAKLSPTEYMELSVPLPTLGQGIISIAASDQFVIALTSEHSVFLIKIPKTWEYASFADEYTPDFIANEDEDDDDEGENDTRMDLDATDEIDHEAAEEARRLEREAQKQRRLDKLMPACLSYRQAQVQASMQWTRLQYSYNDLYSAGVCQDGSNFWDEGKCQHLIESLLSFQHISAYGNYFALCAPDAGDGSRRRKKQGVIIIGNISNPFKPVIIPRLQGEQVIEVGRGIRVAGQVCWSALTKSGEVLCWDEFRCNDLEMDPTVEGAGHVEEEDIMKMGEVRSLRFTRDTMTRVNPNGSQEGAFVIDVANCNRSKVMAVLAVDRKWLIPKEQRKSRL